MARTLAPGMFAPTPSRWRAGRELVGLAGLVVAFVAIGWLFAFTQQPFEAPDEVAHLGYTHELADFHLPEIDRPADVPAAAVQWQAELDSRGAPRYQGVWVANHPPLSYLPSVPLVWLAELTDRADGGLLFLRLANVVSAAAGVVFTYLLASELTGGNRRLGLAAAALAALVPQGHIVFSQGLNDGFAFAAGTAVLWAGVRVIRRGATRGELALLAATVAAACGARAATMLLAIATVAYVALAKRRAATVIVAAGVLPAAALWGWFYVRNIVLYGDLGASDHLLRLFRRRRRGSVLEMMTRGRTWVGLYQRLLSPSTLRRRVPPLLTTITVLLGAGALAAVVFGRRVSRAGMGLGLVAVGVIAVSVAQHVSGGGNAYPRYLFPVLGVLAAFAAIGADRVVPRAGPLLLATALGWWAMLSVRRFRVGVDALRIRRPRDSGGPPPDVLRVLPVGDAWRLTCAVTLVAGLTVAAAVMVVSALRRGASPTAAVDEPPR